MPITHILHVLEHGETGGGKPKGIPVCSPLLHDLTLWESSLLSVNVQPKLVTRNNRQRYYVLFGLHGSLANKGTEIKLSLQKYSANDTSDFFQCLNSLPWKMENEPPVEHSICLNLSLLSGERLMLYGMKQKAFF